MSLREMLLPQDIGAIEEVSLASFQYPDHPEWSMQAEEIAETRDMVAQIRRYWPLLSILRRFSARFRDMFLGFVWEEDGRAAGLTLYQRQSGSVYYINNVSVLPEYRRRGIARRLVEAVFEQVRSRDGKMILLDVIAGNLPAVRLYEQLGWQHFSGTRHYSFTGDDLPEIQPLPDGCQLVEIPRSQWRPVYELDRRILPARVQAFRPVVESRYREPLVDRLMDALLGMKVQRFLVRQVGGQMVAGGMYNYRQRGDGINHIWLRIDPAHEQIAGPLLHTLMHRVQGLAQGKNLEVVFPTWQETLPAVCTQYGLAERYTYLTMGLEL